MPDATSSPLAASAAPFRLWPAIAVTILTGVGFAALKFVLIGEQAILFTPAHIEHLPFAWMREMMTTCHGSGLAKEAITQGLAAMLTLGVLCGYVVNCPLAGAWRAAPMFAMSCVGVGVASLLAIQFNAWAMALVVGVSYGAACAARGKVIPLLAEGTGKHNTFVSGLMNASLVIGLLVGTVVGLGLASAFIGNPPETTHVAAAVSQHGLSATSSALIAHSASATSAQEMALGLSSTVATSATSAAKGTAASLVYAPWIAHVLIAVLFAGGVLISLQVRTPSCPTIPFSTGMRSLLGDTAVMCRKHWALLVSGGIVWGIAAAASLTVLVWAITEVKMNQVLAGSIAVFAAIGAILGNLISDKLNRRRYAVSFLLLLGVVMMLVPYLLTGYLSGAILMTVVGVLFACPANIVDARLLHLTNQEGLPGRGATVMSLVHNVFIFIVGVGLAVPLFMNLITAKQQFWILTGFAVLAAIVTVFAELRDGDGTQRQHRPTA